MSKCTWIVLCAAAAACTPKLAGICSANADCKTGESCSADGICLRGSDVTGTGNGDAGTAASIDIVFPQSGAIEKSTFHVSAQTSSAVTVDSVNFVLSNASNGGALGSLTVTTSSANTWSGDITISAASFGGAANLVAVLQRAGHPDVTSSHITVTIDQNAPSISPTWSSSQWWPLDAGLSLTAAIADDRSGVASAALTLPDGGTTTGTIAGGVATFQLPASAVGSAGAAIIVPVSLSASDLAGNQTPNADAGSLGIDDQPPSIALQPIDATVWRNGPLDVNANVNDGTGSGLASTSLLLGGAFNAGTPDGGGGYNYHANLSTLAPTEAAVAVQVLATDAVGNPADAGFSINVDNVSPAVSGARIETAFDGTDSASQGWFSGPTAAPSLGAIAVSAVITDTNLVTTGTHAPVAIVGTTRYTGTLTAGRWNFSIPRSVGLNATASIAVSFDAQDLAGNHPVSPPSLTMRFDDVPAASFKPAIASDTAWHARTGSLAIDVSFGTAPRSGFASVLLKVNAQTDVTCTSSSAFAWSCALPTADATAGAEGSLSLSVVAKSVTNIPSSSAGFRNIDDAAPVILSTSVPYPAAGTWGHDGSHFTLRDSGTLYTFAAYDCGSGLNTNPVSFAISPQLATRGASITNSGGTHTCPSGAATIVYNVAVSGDLSTSAPGSFAGADNTFSASATVQDMVNHQSTSNNPAINATRRLWQTGNIGATTLAVGPTLAVAETSQVQGLALSSGTPVWTSSGIPGGAVFLASPVVGGTAAAPVVFYAYGGLNTAGTMAELNASSGVLVGTTCGLEGALGTLPSGCTVPSSFTTDANLQGHFRSVVIAVATDGSALFDQTFLLHGANTNVDCGKGQFWAGTMSGGACSQRYTVGPSTTTVLIGATLAVGRSGHTFQEDDPLSCAAGTTGFGLEEVTLGNPTVITGPACAGVVVSDSNGSDSIFCGGGRYTFTGASFQAAWTNGNNPLITAPTIGMYLNTSAYSSSGGSAVFSLGGTAWAIDGSATPVVYLANGVSVTASYISASGVGATAWGLPALPGTSVSDVAMDKSGVLYVASGGQVSAIATDSPGLGTGGYGWPLRARDACRSSNLEYSCPW